jgi:hypothetical protein
VIVTEPLPESEKKKKPEGPDAPVLSTPRPAPLHRFRWALFLFVAAVLALICYFGWRVIMAWKHWMDEIMAS